MLSFQMLTQNSNQRFHLESSKIYGNPKDTNMLTNPPIFTDIHLLLEKF
jgi:hypothetical protein